MLRRPGCHPCSLPASPRPAAFSQLRLLACLPLLHSYHFHTWVSQPLVMGSGQEATWNPAHWQKRDSSLCRLRDTTWANPDRKVKQIRFYVLILFADSHSFELSLSLPEMILRKYLNCISWRFHIWHQRKRLAASLCLISNWELCSSGLCTGWQCSPRKRANMARAFFFKYAAKTLPTVGMEVFKSSSDNLHYQQLHQKYMCPGALSPQMFCSRFELKM